MVENFAFFCGPCAVEMISAYVTSYDAIVLDNVYLLLRVCIAV